MVERKLNRRQFLRDAGILLGGLGLSPLLQPKMAEALELLAGGQAPIVWLEGQSCSGCSVSFLNSENPGPAELLTRYLSAYYHPVLTAATGEVATQVLERSLNSGNYLLVVEGAVPMKMPQACRVADENFLDLFQRAAKNADTVLALGTCAAFGGVPAAPPNLTGAVPVGEAMKRLGLKSQLINLPGCPAHPNWLLGTLGHLLKIGTPELDEFSRPKQAYGELLHNKCPYFAKYQAKEFALNFGEPGCQFKLGCQGVITHANCPTQQWNGATNWCVEARGVCVGCAHPDFVKNPDFALYRLGEENLSV